MSAKSDIIDSKVFVGHPKNLSNPKTREFWLTEKNGMIIFNPDLIQEQLDHAKKVFKKAKRANQEILIICEKEIYSDEVEKIANDVGAHYLNYKVPAGVLTNFDTLLGRIRSLNDMRQFVDSDAFNTLTKKEQQMRKRSLKKIERVYKGVVNLRKQPDLVVIVDGQFMDKFVNEVEQLDVNAIILASSNFNRRSDKHLVMCNVNSRRSLDHVLKSIVK